MRGHWLRAAGLMSRVACLEIRSRTQICVQLAAPHPAGRHACGGRRSGVFPAQRGGLSCGRRGEGGDQKRRVGKSQTRPSFHACTVVCNPGILVLDHFSCPTGFPQLFDLEIILSPFPGNFQSRRFVHVAFLGYPCIRVCTESFQGP